MKTFEAIDISGEAGIRAFGETIEDLFINSAAGMYSLITDPEGILEQRQIAVEIESPSREGLLVSWLNELIFHFDAYGFVGRRIVITEISPSRQTGQVAGESYMLRATVSGEDFDPERHQRRLLIKAATYHMLKIEKKDGGWEADVIFDI